MYKVGADRHTNVSTFGMFMSACLQTQTGNKLIIKNIVLRRMQRILKEQTFIDTIKV